MNILMTGGTGFIGGFLVPRLLQEGHSVSILTRSVRKSKQAGLAYLEWDGKNMPMGIGIYDAVINLAGANIGKLPWTEENKALFRSSRVDPTKACVSYINRSPKPPHVFISASATGYYGMDRKEELDEESSPGKDYFGELCSEWELEAKKAKSRTVILRTGVVVGEGSEIINRLKPLYQMFLGGKLASGKQGFPWIHIEDNIRAILFALEQEELEGPVNLVAPQLTLQKEFSAALAKALGVPDIWTVPAFALAVMFGKEKSGMFTGGLKVHPKKLIESGFEFTYGRVNDALEEIVG